MPKIDCSLYAYRDPRLSRDSICLVADDGRAWTCPIDKIASLKHEADSLPQEFRFKPTAAYKFLGRQEMDDAALDREWQRSPNPVIKLSA